MRRHRQILVVALGNGCGEALLVKTSPGGCEIQRIESFDAHPPKWVRHMAARAFFLVAPYALQTLISIYESSDAPANAVSLRRRKVVAGGLSVVMTWRQEQVSALLDHLAKWGLFPDAVIPPALGVIAARSAPISFCEAESSRCGCILAAHDSGRLYMRTIPTPSDTASEGRRMRIALNQCGWDLPELKIAEHADSVPASLLNLAQAVADGTAKPWNLSGAKARASAVLRRNQGAILAAGFCFCATPLSLICITRPYYKEITERATAAAEERATLTQQALHVDVLEKRWLELKSMQDSIAVWQSQPAMVTDMLAQLQTALEVTPALVLERIEIGPDLLVTGRCAAGEATYIERFANSLRFRGGRVSYELRPLGDGIRFRLTAGEKEAQ